MTVHKDVDAGLADRLASDPALAALVGDRIYPDFAPQGKPYPRITYQRISARRLEDFGGPSGMAWPRVQVDIWAKTKGEAKQVAREVRRLLYGYSGPLGDEAAQLVRLVDEGDSKEPPSDGSTQPTYRIRHDYLITSEEDRPNRVL